MFFKLFPSSLQLSLLLNTLVINKSTVWLETAGDEKCNAIYYKILSAGS